MLNRTQNNSPIFQTVGIESSSSDQPAIAILKKIITKEHNRRVISLRDSISDPNAIVVNSAKVEDSKIMVKQVQYWLYENNGQYQWLELKDQKESTQDSTRINLSSLSNTEKQKAIDLLIEKIAKEKQTDKANIHLLTPDDYAKHFPSQDIHVASQVASRNYEGITIEGLANNADLKYQQLNPELKHETAPSSSPITTQVIANNNNKLPPNSTTTSPQPPASNPEEKLTVNQLKNALKEYIKAHSFSLGIFGFGFGGTRLSSTNNKKVPHGIQQIYSTLEESKGGPNYQTNEELLRAISQAIGERLKLSYCHMNFFRSRDTARIYKKLQELEQHINEQKTEEDINSFLSIK